MKRITAIAIILLLFCSLGLAAKEKGSFQINTVFMTTSYPLSGVDGKDLMENTSVGVSLRSTIGTGFIGLFDLTVFFTRTDQIKIYPADDFIRRARQEPPTGYDAVLGIGYRFDLSPVTFTMSTGFHTGAWLESIQSNLITFGITLDAQLSMKFGKTFTTQVGFRMNLDFGGLQSFTAIRGKDFAGVILGYSFYTGIGFSV